MTTKNQDLMKMALTACLSIIVTGAAAWMVFGQDRPARSEVEAMINRSLLVVDAKVQANATAATELKGSVTELVKAQHALVIEQRVLIERVNTLVDRIEEGR